MHIPTTTVNLQQVKYPQICLGLQGAPGTGKTYSALTFPNPIVLDIDNGLTRFGGTDLTTVPVFDHDWCCNLANGKYKPKKQGQTPDRMSIIEDFLLEEAMKMSDQQTLIIDSWSSLQDAFDQEQNLPHRVVKRMTKTGEEDKFKFWDEKIKYSKRILSLVRSLKCHVIVTFHELQVRHPDTGVLLDKVAPLMQGKFVAELKRFFTDWFRVVNEETRDATKKNVVSTQYFWQIRPDNQCDTKTRLNVPDGTYRVEPHYKIFEQYGYNGIK